MMLRAPRSTRTHTLFSYTTLFRCAMWYSQVSSRSARRQTSCCRIGSRSKESRPRHVHAFFSCCFPFICRGFAAVALASRGGAAILHEVGNQRIHRRIIGAVNDRPVLALLLDQPRAAKLCEVKRERAVGNAERLSNRTRRHASPARLHEQTEQREPVLLRKRAERIEGRCRIHGDFLISILIEMMDAA